MIEGFLALLAEELSRAYTAKLKRALHARSQAMGAAEERLLSLQMVAGAVAQERDETLTLDLIARQVVKLIDADAAAIFLPDESGEFLRPTLCVTRRWHPLRSPRDGDQRHAGGTRLSQRTSPRRRRGQDRPAT